MLSKKLAGEGEIIEISINDIFPPAKVGAASSVPRSGVPSKSIEMLLPVVYTPTSSYRSQTGYKYSKEGREYEYQLYF
jgi:hypothetical protein